MPSLFASDFDYLAKGIQRLAEKEQRDQIAQFEKDEIIQRISFTAPESLKHRFKSLSKEIYPKNGQFILSAKKEAIYEAITESRQSEDSWANVHYLWELHPIFPWLNNKVVSGLKRQEAPVIVAGNRLEKDEIIYITYSLIPNQKGQPLIQRWFGVSFISGKFNPFEDLERILDRTGLKNGLPNQGNVLGSEKLSTLKKPLPDVISQVKKQMTQLREHFDAENREKLKNQEKKLKNLKSEHYKQLNDKINLKLEELKSIQLEGESLVKFDDLYSSKVSSNLHKLIQEFQNNQVKDIDFLVVLVNSEIKKLTLLTQQEQTVRNKLKEYYLKLNCQLEKIKTLKQESEAIHSRFKEYLQWVNDSMITEKNPYIQIVAAIVPA
jgi:Sec-independent protein translocase protein TatA